MLHAITPHFRKKNKNLISCQQFILKSKMIQKAGLTKSKHLKKESKHQVLSRKKKRLNRWKKSKKKNRRGNKTVELMSGPRPALNLQMSNGNHVQVYKELSMTE